MNKYLNTSKTTFFDNFTNIAFLLKMLVGRKCKQEEMNKSSNFIKFQFFSTEGIVQGQSFQGVHEYVYK